MANNLVSMQHIRSLIQQLQKGYSQRRIARELQLSRNTVKQYACRLLQSNYTLAQLQKIDDAGLAVIIYVHTKVSPARSTIITAAGLIAKMHSALLYGCRYRCCYSVSCVCMCAALMFT